MTGDTKEIAEMEKHECNKDEIVAELKGDMKRHEDRLHQGELMFQELKAQGDVMIGKITGLDETVTGMNKRMCIDNGTPSFQTRLDRHQRMLSAFMYVICLLATSVVGMGIKMILSVIMKSNGEA